MPKTVIADMKSHMEKTIDDLRKEFVKIRTGRASTGLLDELRVDYYGNPSPLSQVATLAVPEPRTITITPWESKMIGPIEKAILNANLGLTPGNDGKTIRLTMPPLTEERRKDIVKTLKKMEEEHKVAVRNLRRKAIEDLKKLEKDKVISEDDLKKYEKRYRPSPTPISPSLTKSCTIRKKRLWKSDMPDTDQTKLPRHLAIIMDGNGRWAEQRMLRRIVGHQRGVETVRMVVEQTSRMGIKYLTLFAFSSENWSRPKTEVRALMSLLQKYIRAESGRMMKNNIRFNVIGNREELPEEINSILDGALQLTAGNSGMVLTLALSYGGRQEIVRAAARLAREVQSGLLQAEQITEELFASHLDTNGLPDPDLLIRTSGEMRISNFLLWQLAYTELYFTDINWPDLTIDQLHRALADYQARERRFGKTSAQLSRRN